MALPTSDNTVNVTRFGSTLSRLWTKIKTKFGTKADLDSPAFTGTPTAPTAADGTNTTQIATTAFVKQAVIDGMATIDAMEYKGTITLGTTSPGAYTVAASKGHTYKVVKNGNDERGYVDGVAVEAGDMIICNADSTAAATSSNYSTIATKWDFIQGNLDGVVIGPASAVDGQIPVFDGATGKLIKNSGKTLTVTSTSVSDGTTTFNKYTHPTTSGNKHIPSGGSSGQFLGWDSDGTAKWVSNPNTDIKVKATAKTDNVDYKVLATASSSPTSGNATEAVYDTDITLNPSTNTISANISGNAATATNSKSNYYKSHYSDSNTNAYGWRLGFSEVDTTGAVTKHQYLKAVVHISLWTSAGSSDKSSEFFGFMEINHRNNGTTEVYDACLHSINNYADSDSRGWSVVALRGTAGQLWWYIRLNTNNSTTTFNWADLSIFPLYIGGGFTFDETLAIRTTNPGTGVAIFHQRRAPYIDSTQYGVGSSVTPVYVDSNGQIQKCSGVKELDYAYLIGNYSSYTTSGDLAEVYTTEEWALVQVSGRVIFTQDDSNSVGEFRVTMNTQNGTTAPTITSKEMIVYGSNSSKWKLTANTGVLSSGSRYIQLYGQVNGGYCGLMLFIDSVTTHMGRRPNDTSICYFKVDRSSATSSSTAPGTEVTKIQLLHKDASNVINNNDGTGTTATLLGNTKESTNTPVDDTYIVSSAANGSTDGKWYKRKLSTLWSWITSHHQVSIFKDSADVYVRVGADSNHCIYLDYDASGTSPTMGLWARWGSGSNAKWMAQCDSSGNCTFNGTANIAKLVLDNGNTSNKTISLAYSGNVATQDNFKSFACFYTPPSGATDASTGDYHIRDIRLIDVHDLIGYGHVVTQCEDSANQSNYKWFARLKPYKASGVGMFNMRIDIINTNNSSSSPYVRNSYFCQYKSYNNSDDANWQLSCHVIGNGTTDGGNNDLSLGMWYYTSGEYRYFCVHTGAYGATVNVTLEHCSGLNSVYELEIGDPSKVVSDNVQGARRPWDKVVATASGVARPVPTSISSGVGNLPIHMMAYVPGNGGSISGVGSNSQPIYADKNGRLNAVNLLNTANNLLSSLPTNWTATPTGTTQLIRRDTGGGNSFGLVTFNTVWSFIKDQLGTAGSTNLPIYMNAGVPTAIGSRVQIPEDSSDAYVRVTQTNGAKAYLEAWENKGGVWVNNGGSGAWLCYRDSSGKNYFEGASKYIYDHNNGGFVKLEVGRIGTDANTLYII